MTSNIMGLTVEVVASYVANHHVPREQLGLLLTEVNGTLRTLEDDSSHPKREAAANLNETVNHDHLICMSCGKKCRSLRKHIVMKHGMTPEQYREKWNLRGDYPMVSQGFSERRSEIAKETGLGEKGKIERTNWRKYT